MDIEPQHFVFGSDYPMRSASRHMEALEERLPIGKGDLDAILQGSIWEESEQQAAGRG